ncbi:MAG: hypothetical protein ACXABO_08645 [Promethearchaeota archaeon]|jgi:hypothetical protein
MKSLDRIVEHLKVKISISKDIKSIERYYYEGLARCLKYGHIESFKKLFDASIDFNIFIDIKKIPNRFELISNLLLKCIERISNNYQTSALGDQIDILRFCNEYGLLERKLTENEKESIKPIKNDRLLLSNLKDLTGKVSDSFIFYIHSVFPRVLYNHFMSSPNEYFTDRDNFMYYIKNHFFNQYTIYGLSIRYLSSTEQFISTFKKNYTTFKNQAKKGKLETTDPKHKFVEFNVIYRTHYYGVEENHEYREIKKHFVSPANILRNLDHIIKQDNYNFYSISMVLLGGLGPQGLGFTYSTPKGEIVEICSDQKENEAIIIKYKQFLKRKFLGKLNEELENFNIEIKIREKIINYLSEVLDPGKLINYYDKDLIIKKIMKFLHQIDEFQKQYKVEFIEILNKVTRAVSIILRKIKLKDQFITRMDLVSKGKVKSEDIAKLTSLKGKSHYDVLRERFFFQYIIDWFYEIYMSEKVKRKQLID